MTARTIESIVEDLRAIGVRRADTLMVHASMRSLGPIEGGALGLIEALDRAVGTDGTLLMTLGADDPWSWVNEHDLTVDERLAALADATPFETASTAADPDVGVLAEVFRTALGSVVNDHPEGRFGARGHRAHAMVDNPPWDDYYGPGSPLERLVQSQGKVLRLGASLDTVTLLHYAEFLCDMPDKRRVTRHRHIAAPDGPVVRTVNCLDDSDGIVAGANDLEDYFITITRAALAAGLATVGRVGAATAELFDAGQLVDFAADWMTANLA